MRENDFGPLSASGNGGICVARMSIFLGLCVILNGIGAPLSRIDDVLFRSYGTTLVERSSYQHS